MDELSRVATLGEPVRRELYRVVAAARGWISREQAASEAGVAPHTAKFHLDRLAEAGLLDVDYQRLSGRTGPGAGRPSKLYRRSSEELSVNLPERAYDLLGRILASAVVESGRSGKAATVVAPEIAHREGAAYGASGARKARNPLTRLAERLGDLGYEPARTGNRLELTNCPFHAVAQEQTDLVCGVNLAFVEGVVEGLECPGLNPRLEPHGERCCVTVESKR